MKKLLIITLVLLSVKSYSQISFGGMIGLQQNMFKENTTGSSNYGGWIDFGSFGVQYQSSAHANFDNNQINSFINGNSSTYNAGGVTRNYGMYINDNTKTKTILFYGFGVQHTKNVLATTNSILPVFKNSVSPYFNIGAKYKLNEIIIGRGDILLSEISSINIGIGFLIN